MVMLQFFRSSVASWSCSRGQGLVWPHLHKQGSSSKTEGSFLSLTESSVHCMLHKLAPPSRQCAALSMALPLSSFPLEVRQGPLSLSKCFRALGFHASFHAHFATVRLLSCCSGLIGALSEIDFGCLVAAATAQRSAVMCSTSR